MSASAALINEVAWIIYFYLALKSNRITSDSFIIGKTTIDENYIVNSIEKHGLDDIISTFGMSSNLDHLKSDISAFNRTFKGKKNKVTGFFITKQWHKALLFQCEKFKSNQKISFVKKSTMNVCRQDYFYQHSEIGNFITEVFKIFSASSATPDRWNPADVWFYDDESIKQIKDFISLCTINQKSLNKFKKREKKVIALSDVMGLNKLMLRLYRQKKICPISLKKATNLGPGNFSYRLSEQNIPKTREGKPKEPTIISKEFPVEKFDAPKTFVAGEKSLKFKIRCEYPILNTDGTIKYENEVEELFYHTQKDKKTDRVNSKLTVKSTMFTEANAGSIGFQLAENILYNAKAARVIKQARKNNIVGYNVSNIISNKVLTDSDSQLKYLGELGKILDPTIGNEYKPLWGKTKTTRDFYLNNSLERKNNQNKVEIATAIKLSGKEDEIILDLWKAATGKKITNRKDYEVMIEKVSNVLYKKSQKPGQTKLTRKECDIQAIQLIKSHKVEGNPLKIPGGFHLKLY